jgi:hypothetical protein
VLYITNPDVSTDIASIGFGCPGVFLVSFDDFEPFTHERFAEESGTSEHINGGRFT